MNVRFPGGVISEWYPNASTYSPEIGEMEALKNGSMSWNVDVHTQPLSVPPVEKESTWAPSRTVASNFVSVGNENEKFIFYRGLGRFNTPLHVQTKLTEVRLENPSK